MGRGADDSFSEVKTRDSIRQELLRRTVSDSEESDVDTSLLEEIKVPNGKTVERTEDFQGYTSYKLLDDQGGKFFYKVKEGLDNGDPATIIKEKKTSLGSHKIEVWIKKIPRSGGRGTRRSASVGWYNIDYREERRNSQGELHSPDQGTPAVIIKKERYNTATEEAHYYDNGQLLKKVVYRSSFDEAGDNIEIFDGEGKLHSFSGLPARIYDRDVHEFYQHGELQESGAGDYRVYDVSSLFFSGKDPMPEIVEYME